MIVIENVGLVVLRIDRPANAHISRAEVTVGEVRRQRRSVLLHGAATPGTILPVCRDDHPLFSQRMPPLFPRHFVPFRPFCGPSSITVVELPSGIVNASRS